MEGKPLPKEGKQGAWPRTRPYKGNWTMVARYRLISIDEALSPDLKAKVLAFYAEPMFEL